ncbi:MAG: signal peptidase II [Rhodothermales bacterium]
MRKATLPLLTFLMTLTCIGCDQITKEYARDHLLYGAQITLVEDVVHLAYTENSGIAFGIGGEWSHVVRFWLFGVGIVAVLLVIAFVAYRRRERGPFFLGGLTLIMAGGASNLIDRMMNNGQVVDFVVVHVGGLSTIVFNLADILIVTGAVVLVVSATKFGSSTARSDGVDQAQ